MFDDYRICPYPGLRSFNEDESIYFKGREENIVEVIALLQKNKFLMVTGASGDGKSSLIFAGLVPNARAGFFKATYNNWSVSHFRPERDPVRNFSHSLIQLFTELNEQTIETELNRGFSSLVDLYKNSPLFFDESTNQYQDATEEEQRSIKRQSSNLLIVVDQFEEFFTNSENFIDGVPSLESQTLINLLLETAQIALRDNLPIYVVFTMRSDYIGQCASFRGLPEYIGFSQFFVPRLKRKDLQQVIEQPAELNGDTISRRLVERLLFDLSDGEDQLPILQHTLSRIWHRAEEQKVPMDLVHYAEVGGMPALELPGKEKEQFEIWYANLPDWKKSEYKKPGLRRVLHIHANDLYQVAWERYSESNPTNPISIADAKRIIAITFACLTKIDDSRPVRNLMSIGEITKIINRKHITLQVVDSVLRIFREEGNTFIRPFIEDENPETDKLTNDTVLDITHESLIRNWDKLLVWAEKEFSYYETFLDFQKQLDKWLESNKSKDFLLPIGSLTYFETWYEECQPNVYWISRYLQLEADDGKAASILSNIQNFLKRSAQKVVITRTFMRYGTARIASFIAIFLVIGLSGFYYIDAIKKQNESVLVKIRQDGIALFNDPSISSFSKAIFLLASERVNENALISNLEEVDTVSTRIDVANTAYMIAFSLDNKFNPRSRQELVSYISNQLDKGEMDDESHLEQLNYYLFNRVNEIYNLNTPDISRQKIQLLKDLLEKLHTQDVNAMLEFNHGINNVMNLGSLDDVREILELISPFESSKEKFDRLYPINASLINGRVGGLTHNSGYQVVGSLYACLGNLTLVKQSLDSLLMYNPNYMEEESYMNGFDFIGYMLRYDHEEMVPEFMDYFSKMTGIDKITLMQSLMDRTGYMKFAFSYYWWEVPAYNYGLSLIGPDNTGFLFDYYEQIVKKEFSGDELNYQLAMLYKQRGVYLHKYLADRDMEISNTGINEWFEKSLEFYAFISDSYLQAPKTVRYRYYSDGFRSMVRPRWYFFLYPDHMETGWYNDKFTSTSFANFLINNDKLNQLYNNSQQLEVFNDWIANYYERFNINNAPEARRNLPELPRDLLLSIYKFANSHDTYSRFDKTYLDLLLANIYFDEDKEHMGIEYFNSLVSTQLQPLVTRWEYLNYTFIQNEILSLAKHLARRGDFDGSKTLLETMSNNNDRSICYTEVAKDLFKNGKAERSFIFLDSAISKGEKTDLTIAPNQLRYRYYLINALSAIGGKKMNDMASNMSNQVPVTMRDFAINFYIQGIAFEGDYYRAYQAIPTVGLKDRRLFMFSSIYGEESERNGARVGWEQFDAEWKHVFKDYVVFDDNY